MVLSRSEILRHLSAGQIVFEPGIEDDQVKQVSVDLRLGRKFASFRKKPAYLTEVRVHESLFQSKDLWEHREADRYVIEPGGFVLGHTLERVRIPDDLVGLIEGRSSWARTGVSVHLTAPKIDPGFEGQITLEIANQGKMPIRLVAEEDKPAQMLFLQLSHRVDEKDLYGTGDDDLFQYQTDPIPRGSDR